MLSEINKKVVSYCEIPEELTQDHWIQEYPCDCYVEYTLSSADSALDRWFTEIYPELIQESFLIHLDY